MCVAGWRCGSGGTAARPGRAEDHSDAPRLLPLRVGLRLSLYLVSAQPFCPANSTGRRSTTTDRGCDRHPRTRGYGTAFPHRGAAGGARHSSRRARTGPTPGRRRARAWGSPAVQEGVPDPHQAPSGTTRGIVRRGPWAHHRGIPFETSGRPRRVLKEIAAASLLAGPG